MTATPQTPPLWVEPVLAALRAGETITKAARAAGVWRSTVNRRRQTHRDFGTAFDAARRTEGDGLPGLVQSPAETSPPPPPPPSPPPSPPGAKRRLTPARLERFLEALGDSSNVAAAAAAAQVTPGQIYKLRRADPAFARRWFAALAEGYDNLEMELLGRLRAGEGGDTAARRLDTATALRCLAAHRESVAREKGRRTLADEVTTIASINAKIDRLRLAGEAGDKAITAARKASARRRKGADDVR